MATFVFDGTSNITAAKTDTVVITANPALFTSVSDNGGNSVFNFGGKLLTVTGTNFGANATSYPNITLAGGTFSTAAASPTVSGPNDLIIAPTGTTAVLTTDGTASSVKAIFGGLGVSDPIDGNDTITIGGKGSFLVYGNGGDDTISSVTTAFDSTSAVTVFGGKGTDTINFNNTAVVNQNAKFAIYGGEGTDTISVQNTGTSANTFIAGGQGAADSSDGNDTIRFIGGGTVNIFANAGDDTVNIGGTNGTAAAGGTAGSIDSTAAVTVHGGLGVDTITVNVGTTAFDNANPAVAATTGSVKASIVAYGDEGADTISVLNNAGTTVIYGDTAAADSNGGNDTITFSGQGTATIYAAGGNDSITLSGAGNATADSTSTVTVFGGNGNDQVTIGAHTDGIGTYNLTLGAGADVVKATTTTAGAVVGQNVNITDFTVGTGGDSISLVTGVAASQATAVGGNFQTLQQALDAAANAVGGGTTAGTVGVVTFSGNTYVVVNETTTAGFNAANDLAIKLTGVTDALSVAANVSTTVA